jgi:hypothetical protein
MNYPNSVINNYQKPMKPQNVPAYLNPIVQPTYVNQMPVTYSPVYPIPVVPQPSQYVTPLDPVYIDHLSRHKGQKITVMTTAGKLEGVLTGIAVDHIQVSISEERALHIRIAEIVFFEGFPVSYK